MSHTDNGIRETNPTAPGLAAPRATDPPRRRAAQRIEDANGSQPASFAPVLDLAQQHMRARLSSVGDRSPAQLFEVNGAREESVTSASKPRARSEESVEAHERNELRERPSEPRSTRPTGRAGVERAPVDGLTGGRGSFTEREAALTGSSQAAQDHAGESDDAAWSAHRSSDATKSARARSTGAASSISADVRNQAAERVQPVERAPVEKTTPAAKLAAVRGAVNPREIGAVESTRGESTARAHEVNAPRANRERESGAKPGAAESAGKKTGSPVLDPADGERFRTEFSRQVQSLRLKQAGRYSSATMQLHPPELGRLVVDVRLAGEQLRVHVRTQTQEARRVLARRADELRDSLAQHGLMVEQLDVTWESAESSAIAPKPPARANHGDAVEPVRRKDNEKSRASTDRAAKALAGEQREVERLDVSV